MIIWIASYPRSGNTLVRTILKQVFNINSYDNEFKISGQPWIKKYESIYEKYGHIEFEGEWKDIYLKLKDSKEIFFVKTHLPPEDNSPAIYIVRDGRMSIISYFHYMQKFFSDANRSILEILLGYDYYGDWSSHYRIWNPQERENTLCLKYEDILNKSELTIKKLEQFINLEKKADWENPFNELNKQGTEFFRKGESTWNESNEWSDFYNYMFMLKHYKLMYELDYLDNYKFSETALISAKECKEIIKLTQMLKEESNMYKKAALERLELINKISS
ncbi:hypothetical protein CRV08_10765 [Halarcobacter ebronensis]|uniref:Sulfotransferase domain-containing protein n=1 Tax=Halarcobacter ebronensis TaxID=1462615 RepID=A0A4Q0YAV2_9BACT|nr:sulfotransferase domain-containing protein [Halarcobacter ebronensis]RXJ67402.1 hypothetical protein CRV08_10765 [Halarcobacter ebronensis]